MKNCRTNQLFTKYIDCNETLPLYHQSNKKWRAEKLSYSATSVKNWIFVKEFFTFYSTCEATWLLTLIDLLSSDVSLNKYVHLLNEICTFDSRFCKRSNYFKRATVTTSLLKTENKINCFELKLFEFYKSTVNIEIVEIFAHKSHKFIFYFLPNKYIWLLFIIQR